jgi:hypothetical protein
MLGRVAVSQYCVTPMKDLPNMGEAERGKVPAPPAPVRAAQPTSPSDSPTPRDAPVAGAPPLVASSGVVRSWFMDRWRWGVLLVVAVAISRFTRQ